MRQPNMRISALVQKGITIRSKSVVRQRFFARAMKYANG